MAGREPRKKLHKVIGVDLGGTKLLGGVVDEHLEVHSRVHRSVMGLPQAEVIDTTVDAVSELLGQVPDVEAVGFGIPCLIDQRTGVAVMAVNLEIQDFPFRDEMTKRLGLPVFIDNDANVTTLVEQRFGAAKGATEVVGLTIGTGIGGGLVLGGHVYRGFTGGGAELGHMVVDEDGPPCQGHCPNRGCLEAVASGTAIGKEGAIAAGEEPEHVANAPAGGDLAIRIAQQRERQAVVLAELGVRRSVVARDPDHLGAGCHEIFVLITEAARLLRAAVGLVLGVEVDDQRLADPVAELRRPFRAYQGRIRHWIAGT